MGGHIIGNRVKFCNLVAMLLGSTAAQAVEFTHAGLLEFDWARTTLRTDGQRTITTDPSLATLELGLTAQFTPAWHSDLLLLAEDIGATDHNDYIPAAGATDKRPDRLHVEEFTLGYAGEALSAAIGRMTVPFGVYETVFLSDPQTLEVGETMTEAGGRAAYQYGHWQFGTAVFNGNLRSVAPDTTGYSLSVRWDNELHYASLGYLSDQYAADLAPALMNLALGMNGGQMSARLEFTGAPHARQGARPRALHGEVAWEPRSDWQLGLRYQQTSRYSVLEGGSGRYREWAVGTNHAFNEHVSVGLEHAMGRESGARQHATLARLTVSY